MCRQLYLPWREYAKLIKSCGVKGRCSFQISNDCLHFTLSLRDPRLVLKDRLWTGPMGPLTEINAETSHYRCEIERDRWMLLERVVVTVGQMWHKWRKWGMFFMPPLALKPSEMPCFSLIVLYLLWLTDVIVTSLLIFDILFIFMLVYSYIKDFYNTEAKNHLTQSVKAS